MYASFFGLSKEPFSIAPDPRFLFMSEQHREALAHLLYGLGGGGGFVLLTGEVGAGKTTVCRCFLEQVPAHCRVAYIFNPKLSVAELLQTVCGEFGIPLPAQADSVKAHVDALNTFLLEGHAKGEQAVLVIDEAQSLSAEVLEQLRLLTNLETAERKLLQIILIGQPELREMVARPDLEQLAQRIVARYHLGPLSLAETQQYIQHRLSVAGPSAPLPFSAAALARIHALSGGVPRRINLLADRALLGAYAQGQPRAERRTVQQAAREVFGRAPALPARWQLPALAGGGAVVLIVLLAWLLRTPAVPSPVVAAVTGAPAAASQPGPAASAAAAAALAPSPGAADLASFWPASPVPPATAWRELALRWNVAIGEGEPCAAAAQARLACFRSAAGGLAVVRQLGRPGWITLRRPEGGSSTALLLGLSDTQATLQAGGQTLNLPLATLAGLWSGDFSTLWRLPPGWADSPDGGTDPAARAWLAQGLAQAGIAAGPPLPERVRQFQRAQGLPPDGRAGPVTVMRLNRLTGVQEARLAGES
ncbi:peptidoglycan-binding protein [beta proteobacterium AAP121]|nr:peptidoglycan-binding protein [beta proteobacterium AAP65]KPG00779.1 peptidoglycan-binding protein [beta proteobacterium AAP121]